MLPKSRGSLHCHLQVTRIISIMDQYIWSQRMKRVWMRTILVPFQMKNLCFRCVFVLLICSEWLMEECDSAKDAETGMWFAR